MEQGLLNNKNAYVLAGFIIMLGFFLRFHAAWAIPYNWDELDHLETAKAISFDPGKPNLPLVDLKYANPIGYKYLIKIGILFFGDSTTGSRLPFVFLGTLSIAGLFFIVKRILGNSVALIAALLLAVDKFHIGYSRISSGSIIIALAALVVLYFFYKGTIENKDTFFLLSGLLIGVGFWFKENMVLCLPVCFLFLFCCEGIRKWLKNKYLWLGFLISLAFILPGVVLNLITGTPRFSYIQGEVGLGPSINASGLYLGELFLNIIHKHRDFFEYVVRTMDIEYPMETWQLGVIILASVLLSVKNRHPFIRLMTLCFLFNFILFSFIRNTGDIGIYFNSPWAMGSLEWGILGFIPAIILTAYTADKFIKKYKLFGRLCFLALILFLSLKTWDFVNFPLNCFLPQKDYCVSFWLDQARVHRSKHLFKEIFEISTVFPAYKKDAALGLADILVREKEYGAAKKYIDYVLMSEPLNAEALCLQGKMKE